MRAARIVVVGVLAFCFRGSSGVPAQAVEAPKGAAEDSIASGPASQKILTAEDFVKNQLDRGSGNEPVTLVVQIHPKLPAYQFRLVPDLSATGNYSERRRHVGRIEISQFGSGMALQTIEVESHSDFLSFIQWFTARDMNFDGYLDIAATDDRGAQWMSFNYWLFDDRSGRFVSNAFTDQLRQQLAANSIDLDPKVQEIHASYLGRECPGGQSIFKVENGHLVLSQQEKYAVQDDGCAETIEKRVEGKMVVVETRKVAALTH